MVNAARTYLLNRNSGRPAIGKYGEEYIDPAFIPSATDFYTDSIRSALFGTFPDVLTQNYRLAQYMHLLQSHPYGLPYVMAMDPRISYDVDSDSQGFTFGYTNTPIGASSTNGPLWSPWAGDEDTGQHLITYLVTVTDTSAGNITITDPRSETVETFNSVPFVNNAGDHLFNAITHVTTGSTVTLNLPSGSSNGVAWSTELRSRPRRPLTQILDELASKSDSLMQTCRGGTAEPYKTFFNLFRRGATWQDKLSGALLGLIYRTREDASSGR